MEQAVAAVQAVAADPAGHRAAAYEVARQFLAPDRVLPAMIEAIYAAKFETRNSKLESNSKSEA
jgi:hypothetical protein